MRTAVRAVGAATLIGGPTALAFFSGGFFDRPRLIAGIAAWVLVLVAALASPRPLPSSRSGRVALAGMFLLTAWTAVSIAWAPLGGRAQDDLQRLLLYLGFLIASVALLRGPGVRRRLEPTLVMGTLVVVGYGLSERLLPGLIEFHRSRSASGRLEQPITYWNAFGAVAAIGFVLAVRIAGDPERGKALRASAAAAGVPLGLGVYLSFSRGALVAVAAGLLVLVALAPAGRPQLRSAIAMVGAAAAAALVASNLSTVQSLGRGAHGNSGQGLLMLAALIVLAIVAAALVIRPQRYRPLPFPMVVSRRKAVLAIGLVVLLAGVIAAATLEGKPEGVSPKAGASAARLGSIDTNRYRYWQVALEAWADHPVAGIGSGGFAVEWQRLRKREDPSADAHSLYIETAAELGLVGVGVLLCLLGGVAAALVRLYRLEPSVATGLAAGVAAWAIHAGLDWDWEMPALTLIALILVAAGIAWGDEPRAGPAGGRQSVGAPTEQKGEAPAPVWTGVRAS